MTIDINSFNNGSQQNVVQRANRWWTLPDSDMAQAIVATVNSLAQADSKRQTQNQISGRLYGNTNLMGLNGLTFSKIQASQSTLKDRISYNVVQSAIDTVVAKMVKNKPKPLFLTSGGDWKQQRKAEKLNKFVDGIFYENDAYDMGRDALRDAGVIADGFTHVFEQHGRVKYERVLPSELLVDQMEAFYGRPRQLHRVKVIDREVLADLASEDGWRSGAKEAAMSVNAAKADLTGAYNTIANQVAVMESWHLPSGPDATDGVHVIAVEDTVLFKEKWNKPYFPFARLPWSPRLYGYWSQSAAEQIQNAQLEINKLLWVIQRAMHMAGTFKILAERGAKVVKEHFTNDFGVILEYTGTPPQYIIPPIVPPEIYQHLQTLKAQAFEAVGVSMLSATAQKPAGLNAGKALREYQDIESERFEVLGQQYEKYYLELARLSIGVVKDIFARDGKYSVNLPGKKFLETIDWKDVKLEDDEYVMKIFPVSSLPSDPAGRLQTIQEYIQAGFISPRSGRRLLDFPDLEQAEVMANSGEDWLHQVLEKMIDDGDDYMPEPEDNLQMAAELAIEYINHAKVSNVPPERIEMLRTFLTRVNQSTAAAQASAQPVTPQANPQPTPTSELVPNVPAAA